MHGNVTMKGYLKNPKATQEAFEGGWFHSGDLGVWHPDGYVELKDRSKDIIISGGENISSIEVEDTLYTNSKIAAVAVVATPSEKWGETPTAFIELKPGEEATPEEIIEFCRNKWLTTNAHAGWCSTTCPRPPQEKSKNSSCGSACGT